MSRFTGLWSMVLVTLSMAPVLAGCDGGNVAGDGQVDEALAGGEEHAGEEHAEDAERGPNGGRMLEEGAFALELAIFESGVPPEYHAWATLDGAQLPPADVNLVVELSRLGGAVDRIDFTPQAEFLRGNQVVREPHSFDVAIVARHAGREYRFAYESYEGRTTIPADVAAAAGIATAVAGPATIREEILLYGAIEPDATRVREVGARFAGTIESVAVDVGERVRAGETLATIEANDSLRTYEVTAPIAGTITARHAAQGEQTDADSLFTIVDFASVWAELDVFPRDRPRVSLGLPAAISAGSLSADGTISYLAAAGERATQRVGARVVLDNAGGLWTPGQFVEARVTAGETPVALAVPLSALQTFRDFDVVFARVGDTYEVRMLTLGRRDSENVEVEGGLEPGTVIVTDNSYLIKADIEKSGASHDH